MVNSNQVGSNSNQSEMKAEKENKEDQKRVITKKGRQAPRMDGVSDEENVIE